MISYKRIKNIVLLMLVLMFTFSTALPVHAASGNCGSNLTWSLSGGVLNISGSGAMTNFTDENMPPWYGNAAEITKVTIGEGVTSVGDLAFFGCQNLSSVSLPSNVKTIGVRSFKECTALSHVAFPAELESIKEAAFEACSSLTGIRLPDGLKVIGNYAFYRCSNLTSITVPASVIQFGMVTFAYCENLTQATIQCPITKLPEWTFYECGKLAAVNLPETVTSTGENAFYECDRLRDIHYTGVADIKTEIEKESGSLNSESKVTDTPYDGTSDVISGNIVPDGSGGTTTGMQVQETPNSTTTTETITDTSFTVNGDKATLEDLQNRPDQVEVESKESITVNGTVENSDGWTELADKVQNVLDENKDLVRDGEQIRVNINVSDSTVSGSDLAKFAGQSAVLQITTKDGEAWKIDAQSLNEKKNQKKTYNFGISVTEKDGTDIDSDIVFEVRFQQSVDFPVTVGIPVGYPTELASLYQKKVGSSELIRTSLIDNSGVAWFDLASVDKGTRYYIGINVEGISDYDAVIPESMYEIYDITDDEPTLTDAAGTKYKITGRESAWGITGGQFALYVGIVMGGVILIVSLAMITWNKIRQSKEKYKIEDEDEMIDEEALRLQVMKELLEETKEKNAKKLKPKK